MGSILGFGVVRGASYEPPVWALTFFKQGSELWGPVLEVVYKGVSMGLEGYNQYIYIYISIYTYLNIYIYMYIYLDLQNGQNNGPYTAYTLYFGILGHYFGLFWRSRYIYIYISMKLSLKAIRVTIYHTMLYHTSSLDLTRRHVESLNRQIKRLKVGLARRTQAPQVRRSRFQVPRAP